MNCGPPVSRGRTATDDALIGVAYLICNDLEFNWTPQHIASSIHANLDPDKIHVNDVGTMVNIARESYCPNHGYNAGAGDGGGWWRRLD